jgi:hypothetical protein
VAEVVVVLVQQAPLLLSMAQQVARDIMQVVVVQAELALVV